MEKIENKIVAISKHDLPKDCFNGWIGGIDVGQELPMNFDDPGHSNYYKTVMKRGTYICHVPGDNDIHMDVDVCEKVIKYNKITSIE